MARVSRTIYHPYYMRLNAPPRPQEGTPRPTRLPDEALQERLRWFETYGFQGWRVVFSPLDSTSCILLPDDYSFDEIESGTE